MLLDFGYIPCCCIQRRLSSCDPSHVASMDRYLLFVVPYLFLCMSGSDILHYNCNCSLANLIILLKQSNLNISCPCAPVRSSSPSIALVPCQIVLPEYSPATTVQDNSVSTTGAISQSGSQTRLPGRRSQFKENCSSLICQDPNQLDEDDDIVDAWDDIANSPLHFDSCLQTSENVDSQLGHLTDGKRDWQTLKLRWSCRHHWWTYMECGVQRMACPNQAHCSGYWESRNHLSLSLCLAKANYKRIARGIDWQLAWTNKGQHWSGTQTLSASLLIFYVMLCWKWHKWFRTFDQSNESLLLSLFVLCRLLYMTMDGSGTWLNPTDMDEFLGKSWLPTNTEKVCTYVPEDALWDKASVTHGMEREVLRVVVQTSS